MERGGHGGEAGGARQRLEGVLALLGVQLCFGLSPLFAKWTLAPLIGFTPGSLVAWRIVFGALCLSFLAFFQHRGELLPPSAELPRLALCAALGIVLNMWLYMEGVKRTSVVHVGLLVTVIPVFTYGIACLARLERPTGRRVTGIAVALAGALGLVLERAPAGFDASASWVGNLLVMANCLAYAVYLVLARSLLQRHATLLVLAWVFVLSLPGVPLLLWNSPLWPADAPLRVLASLGYTLVFGTFVAYLLNAFALARVPASTVAVFIFLQPLVAGASGVLVLGEGITLPVVGAALALLAGILLVAFERGSSKRGGTSEGIQSLAGRVFHSRR